MTKNVVHIDPPLKKAVFLAPENSVGLMRLSFARFCNKKFGQPINLNNWSRLKAYGDGSLVFTLASDKPQKMAFDDVRRQNLISDQEKNGFLSKGTKSKVKKYLLNWMNAIKVKRECSNTEIYPTFLTVTLSADQFHSDNYIKRNILGRFIQELKRKHQVLNYFWRAESQSTSDTNNGRIHFHLVLDRYIDKIQLRTLWNECQSEYVAKYYLDNSTSTPPPSTYIESFKSISGIVDYCVKYVLKDSPEINDQNQVTKQNNQNKKIYRRIKGRIWGCSDGIRNLEGGFITDRTQSNFKKCIEDINSLDDEKLFVVVGCKFMYIKLDSSQIFKLTHIQKEIRSSGLRDFDSLYSKKKPKTEYKRLVYDIEMKRKRDKIDLHLLELEYARRARNKRIRIKFNGNTLQNSRFQNEKQKLKASFNGLDGSNPGFDTICKEVSSNEWNCTANQPPCPF